MIPNVTLLINVLQNIVPPEHDVRLIHRRGQTVFANLLLDQ